jgi:hypothetical protein
MKYDIDAPRFKTRLRVLGQALRCLFTGKLVLEIGVNQSTKPSDSTYTAEEFAFEQSVRERSKRQHKFDAQMAEAFKKLVTDKEAT